MIGCAKLTPKCVAKSQQIRRSMWLRLSVTAAALFICSNGWLTMLGIAIAQDKPASIERAARPLVRVPTHLTLEEARVIIEAVAGHALMNALDGALLNAFTDKDAREAAILTFLVTMAGHAFLGIGGAFWGLLTGIGLTFVLRREKGR